MRSPLSGPIATLLMFVPLVAIPLFAVFGMPQFSTLAPAARAEDLKFAADKDKPSPKASQESDLIGGVQVTESGTAPPATEGPVPRVHNDADPFAEFIRPAEGDGRRTAKGASHHAETASENHTDSGNDTDSPPRRPQHWPIDGENGPQQKPVVAVGETGSDDGKTARADAEPVSHDPANMTSEEHSRSKAGTRLTAGFDTNRQHADADRGIPDAARYPSDEARSWKAAVARLNALGIHDYQLQPGERAGEFHFSCRFVSRTNPRVMQRFEAEAREPLEAVEQVLEQIDEWKGRRRGARVRTSSRESQSKVTALTPPDETVPVSALDAINR
jgi:hypothetical protein